MDGFWKFLKEYFGIVRCPTCKRFIWMTSEFCLQDAKTGNVYHAFCFHRKDK